MLYDVKSNIIREKYKRVRNFDNKTSDKQEYVEKCYKGAESEH